MITHSLFIFLVTFILVCYSIKKIIYISHMKHLFDEPSEIRKVHTTRTPVLGGVAIFASMMIMSCFVFSTSSIPHLNYIIFSALGIFMLGLTDDLVGVDSIKRMIAQLGIAVTISVFAGYRFTSFYGIFGLFEIPYLLSIVITIIFIILLINAFNLIDGINCLAGGIGLFVCITFAFYFWKMNQPEWMFLSVSLGGSLLGFLYFNRSPARIFMGDSGSTFIGLIISLLAINFIELNKPNQITTILPLFKSAPALIFALLIIPIFDTLRVFIIRITNKISPFTADRNHIHHQLIDLRLSHLQSTGILLLVNTISIMLVSILFRLRPEILMLITTLFILILNRILTYFHSKKRGILGEEKQKLNSRVSTNNNHAFSILKKNSGVKVFPKSSI